MPPTGKAPAFQAGLCRTEKKMRFQFLGTAAAEAIPARFCECPVCRVAREKKGKEIRRRASYLIDDDILVDFGPDSFFQQIAFGIDDLKIRRIIFTHPHIDHLLPDEIYWRLGPSYSQVSQEIAIYGGHRVFAAIFGLANRNAGPVSAEDLHIRPVVLQAGTPVVEDDFELLPMAADHMPGGTAMLYSLTRGGRKVLILNDTGWPPEETWQLLAGQGADMAAVDSTCALRFPGNRNGHLGAAAVKELVAKLKEIGAVKPDARIFATHFSHNGGANHDELVHCYEPSGIAVAYDGLTVTLP